MENKVAVVTGANKGIGYGIVKELCRRGVGTVYLTARDQVRGEKAVENLKNQGYNPKFILLDVNSSDSVKELATHLENNYEGLDILINNAGVSDKDLYKVQYEDSKHIIHTNYNSLFDIQKYIFPLLKNNNARVVNISSNCGHISNLRNKFWIERLTKIDVKVDDINDFINWFLNSVKEGNLKEDDFAEMTCLAYRISKIAICALTRVQQSEIGREVSINSCHPGYVKTDLTKQAGFFTIEEAAIMPVYLVLDADKSLKGKYIWFDKSEKDWADAKAQLYCKLEYFVTSWQKLG